MAETFTDASGNTFPLDPYGRPQGYWANNKYVFPQFGKNFAATQPTVAPVADVASPAGPYRLPRSVAEQQHGDRNGGGDPARLGQPAPTPGLFGARQYSGDVLSRNLANMRPSVVQGLGSQIGSRMLGPLGGAVGGLLGGRAAGRGSRGIAGDIIGTGLGTLALGPIGGLLGIVGGRIGDVSDMERTLGMGERGQRGFLDTLGYGFGLGDTLDEQMSDYYGIDQPGVDPFGAPMGRPGTMGDDFDDIGDIDPGSGIPDSFGDIAAAFGGGDGGGGSFEPSDATGWE